MIALIFCCISTVSAGLWGKIVIIYLSDWFYGITAGFRGGTSSAEVKGHKIKQQFSLLMEEEKKPRGQKGHNIYLKC